MNIAYFLRPKSTVAFLYDDNSFRRGLEKMRQHGYTAIPVINRDGRYISTVSEGDFLWHILDSAGEKQTSMRDLEQLQVRDILREGSYPAVPITVTMDKLLDNAMRQNFIPVVDDAGSFIGIITRQDIIRYFAALKEKEKIAELRCSV